MSTTRRGCCPPRARADPAQAGCDHADDRRRVLYLDTIGGRPPEGQSLVPYYTWLGIEVVGDVDVELSGEKLVEFLTLRNPAPGCAR